MRSGVPDGEEGKRKIPVEIFGISQVVPYFIPPGIWPILEWRPPSVSVTCNFNAQRLILYPYRIKFFSRGHQRARNVGVRARLSGFDQALHPGTPGVA